MEKVEFENLLESAIKLLYRDDATLLERRYNINERTVTHRLALHLTYLFTNFDVDCEYNRMSLGGFDNYTEGDFWAKTLNLTAAQNISAEDDDAKTVFPDIIIHKRRKLVNLAIIEVKMVWKNNKKDFDLKKLVAYKAQLKYNYAIYLELDENKHSLRYI